MLDRPVVLPARFERPGHLLGPRVFAQQQILSAAPVFHQRRHRTGANSPRSNRDFGFNSNGDWERSRPVSMTSAIAAQTVRLRLEPGTCDYRAPAADISHRQVHPRRNARRRGHAADQRRRCHLHATQLDPQHPRHSSLRRLPLHRANVSNQSDLVATLTDQSARPSPTRDSMRGCTTTTASISSTTATPTARRRWSPPPPSACRCP